MMLWLQRIGIALGLSGLAAGVFLAHCFRSEDDIRLDYDQCIAAGGDHLKCEKAVE